MKINNCLKTSLGYYSVLLEKEKKEKHNSYLFGLDKRATWAKQYDVRMKLKFAESI